MALLTSCSRGMPRLARWRNGPVLGLLVGLSAALATSAAPAAAAGYPVADLQVVAVRPSVSQAAPGMIISVTEVTRNNGPEPVVGSMDASQTLSGGTLVSMACDFGVSPDTPDCEYGQVPLGQLVHTKAFIKVTGAPGSTLTIRGTVSNEGDATDPNLANNSAVATVKIVPAADLSLTATDAPDPVVLGSRLTYTLVARNAGPHASTEVSVRDRLPAGVRLISATASQGSGCTAAGTAPVVVTCALGSLASGGQATVRVVVSPTDATLDGQTIHSRATISSTATADPAPDNNTATIATRVL